MEFLSISRYGASNGGEDGAGLSARNHYYRNIGLIHRSGHTHVRSCVIKYLYFPGLKSGKCS